MDSLYAFQTEKKIDGINSNKWYNARQDRTHEIAIVCSYQLNSKWTLSANWVFYTGEAVTFPAGKYRINNQTIFYYTDRNGYRMPSYHRLDLGATCLLKQKKKWSSELNFSLYNAYGRENAYAINFRDSKEDPTRTEAVRYALFRFNSFHFLQLLNFKPMKSKIYTGNTSFLSHFSFLL